MEEGWYTFCNDSELLHHSWQNIFPIETIQYSHLVQGELKEQRKEIVQNPLLPIEPKKRTASPNFLYDRI